LQISTYFGKKKEIESRERETYLYFSKILNKYLLSLIVIPTCSLNSIPVFENNSSVVVNLSEYCSKPLFEAVKIDKGESNGAI